MRRKKKKGIEEERRNEVKRQRAVKSTIRKQEDKEKEG